MRPDDRHACRSAMHADVRKKLLAPPADVMQSKKYRYGE